MRYLSVKDYGKHQHYKDRNPPWIKLHRSTLTDYAFGCLQDASKAHLMLLWLLASTCDNKIPYDLGWIQKQLSTTESIDVEELILQGFIEVSQDDSKPLASSKQNARLEEKRRVEKSQSKEKPVASDDAKLAIRGGWPAEASALWGEKVAPISTGQCGRTLKPSVDHYGWPKVKAAMEKYIVGQPDGKVRDLTQFSKEMNRWVRFGGMRANDETGELTEWGHHLASISTRKAG